MFDGIERQILRGIRVLEISPGPSCSYAGRLFSGSGATVTKLVNESQTLSKFRDSEKEMRMTKDDKDALHQLNLLLEQRFDLILWDSHCHKDILQLLNNWFGNAQNQSIGVYIDFSSGVDLDEEYSLQALGGWMALTGDSLKSPLVIGGYPATTLVGAHMATAGMIGLVEKQWTKRGRIIQIDSLTIMVSALEGAISNYLETGQIRGRPGNRHQSLSPMAILPCADGYALIGAPVDEQWELLERWAELQHRPEWSSFEQRKKDHNEIESSLINWTSKMTRDELFMTGQTFRLPFSKVQYPQELLHCPQLKARHSLLKSQAGNLIIKLPWRICLQEALGKKIMVRENQTSWKGTRILDLTGMWSGPYCTRIFADLGAEVIKVEASHRPDGIRSNQGASAPFFRELNRNKYGIQLDLRLSQDRRRFLDLVKESDVLVENFSPRVMTNYGFTPERLWELQPNLLIVSLSAFGQTGPYREYVGYGPTLESMAGIAALTHYSDQQPCLPGFSISDIGGGIHAAFALAVGKLVQCQQLTGVRIDLSQYETACQFIGDYLVEGTSPQFPAIPVSVRGITELAEDMELSMLSLSGGQNVLGVPWKSNGWEVPQNPPPNIGENSEQVFKKICSEGTQIIST